MREFVARAAAAVGDRPHIPDPDAIAIEIDGGWALADPADLAYDTDAREYRSRDGRWMAAASADVADLRRWA